MVGTGSEQQDEPPHPVSARNRVLKVPTTLLNAQLNKSGDARFVACGAEGCHRRLGGKHNEDTDGN